MQSARKAVFECARRLPDFRGKHNLLRKCLRPLPSFGEFTIESGGALFSIRGVEINEFWMAARGIHSPEIFEKICELAGEREAVIWDIGANIGTMALPLLASRPSTRVVAFEPSPDVCATLLKNARLNPKLNARLTVLNCALSDSAGWVSFYASRETANSGVGGIGAAGNRLDTPLVAFAQTGAECLRVAPAPDIIKIDVEGHELPVLRGLGSVLDRRPLSIIFEHSIYRLKDSGLAEESVTGFLKSRGFRITTLDGAPQIDLEIDQDLMATAG